VAPGDTCRLFTLRAQITGFDVAKDQPQFCAVTQFRAKTSVTFILPLWVS